MPPKTRLTLAASILALAATGPLGAQPLPEPTPEALAFDEYGRPLDPAASEQPLDGQTDAGEIFGADPLATTPLDGAPADTGIPADTGMPADGLPQPGLPADPLAAPLEPAAADPVPVDPALPDPAQDSVADWGAQAPEPAPATPDVGLAPTEAPSTLDTLLNSAQDPAPADPLDPGLGAPADTPADMPAQPPVSEPLPEPTPVEPALANPAAPLDTPAAEPEVPSFDQGIPTQDMPPVEPIQGADPTAGLVEDPAVDPDFPTTATEPAADPLTDTATAPAAEPAPTPLDAPVQDPLGSAPAQAPLDTAPADPAADPVLDPAPADPRAADPTAAPTDAQATTPPGTLDGVAPVELDAPAQDPAQAPASTDPAAAPVDGASEAPTTAPSTALPADGTPTDATPADAGAAPVDGAPEPTPTETGQPPLNGQAPIEVAPTAAAPTQDAPQALPETVQAEVQADVEVQQSVAVVENALDSEPPAAIQPDAQPVAPAITRTITQTRTADQEFVGGVQGTSTLVETDERAREERRRDREERRDRLESVGLGAIAGLVVGAIIADKQEVVATTPERVVVIDRSTNIYQVWRDDDSILRRPGTREETTVYPDGSVRTVLVTQDGTRIETVRNATGRVLKRERVVGDRRVVIVDDLRPVEQVDVRRLPQPRIPRVVIPQNVDPVLGAQLVRESTTRVDRAFSLAQIRNIWEVRRLVPVLDTDPVLFATGSSALSPDQARNLAGVAAVMGEMLRNNPAEVFLIEGHTDAVGSAASNLALSDRRAETIAQALVDYFRIPPANLVFQGYGESLLAVPTGAAEPRNRRVEIRRITPLLDPRVR